MAEKIRSLFQRTRPRDLYDVCQLDDRVRREEVRTILFKKCEYKNINPQPGTLYDRRNKFENAWNISLRHQVRDIPDFDEAFDRMMEMIENYV